MAWCSSGDAARLLSLTPEGVRHLARRGVLRSVRTLSKRYLFELEAVQALVLQRARARHPALVAAERAARLPAVKPRMLRALPRPAPLARDRGEGPLCKRKAQAFKVRGNSIDVA